MNMLVQQSRRLHPSLTDHAVEEMRRVGKAGFVAAVRAIEGTNFEPETD